MIPVSSDVLAAFTEVAVANDVDMGSIPLVMKTRKNRSGHVVLANQPKITLREYLGPSPGARAEGSRDIMKDIGPESR